MAGADAKVAPKVVGSISLSSEVGTRKGHSKRRGGIGRPSDGGGRSSRFFSRGAVRSLAGFLGLLFAAGWLSALFWHRDLLSRKAESGGDDRRQQLFFAPPDPAKLSSSLSTSQLSSSAGGVGGATEAVVGADGRTDSNPEEDLPPRPFLLSPLCRVCAHEQIDGQKTCGDEIREEVLKWWKELKPYDVRQRTLLHPTFRLPRPELLTPDFSLPEWSQEAARVYDDVRLAAERVARRHPEKCGTCDPTLCQDGTRFFRYDSSAPYHERAVVHRLPSVPLSSRVPPGIVGDEERLLAWVRRQWDGTKNRREWLFEYNPTLVHLPNNVAAELGLDLSAESGGGVGGNGDATRYYLASFRLTSANECFSRGTYEKIDSEQWDAIRGAANYLGLAVLDADLTIVPGYDIVVNAEKGLRLVDNFEKDGMDFTDYRIFVSGDDRMWLNINGQSVHVTEIVLSRGTKAPGKHEGEIFPNLFGTGFSVTSAGNFSTVWTGGFQGKNYALFQTPDVLESSPTQFLAEINIWPRHEVQRLDPTQYVQHRFSEVFARQYPRSKERERAKVDADEYQKGPLYRRKFDLWRRQTREVGGMSQWNATDANLMRSAPTVEELWFPPGSVFEQRQHGGGACCVSVPVELFPVGAFGPEDDVRPYRYPSHPAHAFPQIKKFPLPSGFGRASEEPVRARREGRDFRVADIGVDHLLVGVGRAEIPWRPFHEKDPERAKAMPHTQYVSFFYAFEPKPPYRIRLASGYFCLGLPDEHDEDGSGDGMNPYAAMTYSHLLRLNHETFACPQMHYVSGIVDKIGDNMTAVVSYGVNDCIPRMIEIDKREIVSRLHGPLYHVTKPEPGSDRRTVP